MSPFRHAVIGTLSVSLPAAALLLGPREGTVAPAALRTASSPVDGTARVLRDAATMDHWKAAARHARRTQAASRSAAPHPFGTVEYNKWWARNHMARAYGWGEDQFAALEQLWHRESGWDHRAHNASSGAHGIPQALPGSKMGMFGQDWATNPHTQIKWGLHYIHSTYGSPAGALSFWHANHWY